LTTVIKYYSGYNNYFCRYQFFNQTHVSLLEVCNVLIDLLIVISNPIYVFWGYDNKAKMTKLTFFRFVMLQFKDLYTIELVWKCSLDNWQSSVIIWKNLSYQQLFTNVLKVIERLGSLQTFKHDLFRVTQV